MQSQLLQCPGCSGATWTGLEGRRKAQEGSAGHQGRGSSRAGAHPSEDQRQVAGCACGLGRADLGSGEEDGDGHGVLTGLPDIQACQKRAALGGSQPVRQCPGVTWKRGLLGPTRWLENIL